MTSPGRLHVITDVTLQQRFDHEELARLAAEGGADTVQYREKRPSARNELLRTATAMRELLEAHGVDLVVNDRAALAGACGARGLHLGAGDISPRLARAELGPAILIGATANNLEQALEADRQPVDYLGVGPVFGTRSKADPAPILGLRELARIVSAVSRPVIAIGGITVENIDAVLGSGAHGVAVLSGFVCSRDPAEAVASLREAMAAALVGTGGRRDA